MTWPQIVIAVWLSLKLVLGIYSLGKSKASSGYVTALVLVHVAVCSGLGLTLSAGGFW